MTKFKWILGNKDWDSINLQCSDINDVASQMVNRYSSHLSTCFSIKKVPQRPKSAINWFTPELKYKRNLLMFIKDLCINHKDESIWKYYRFLKRDYKISIEANKEKHV